MTDTQMTPADLAELVEKVRRLEVAQGERDREFAANSERYAIPPAPKQSEFTKVAERFSKARHQIRREAAAEAEQVNAEHLERTRAQREKLQQRIGELDEKGRDEGERHDAALASIAADRAPLMEKLNKLSAPPVTYEELLNTPERLEALERIAEEEIAETLPVGLGLSAKEVLEARRVMVGVRG